MNEIKVGNYVKLKNGHAGYIYKVSCAEDDVPRIGVEFKQNVFSTLAKTEVEKIDPKTAFLTELKELLEMYDVEIMASIYDNNPFVQINFFKEKSQITYTNPHHNEYTFVSPKNIMDFDKE